MPHSYHFIDEVQVQGCEEDVDTGTDWLLFQKPQLSNRFLLNPEPEPDVDVALVPVCIGVPTLT